MKTTNLSIKELAAFMGVSTDTIWRAVRKDEIPVTRVGTVLRLDRHHVLTCLRRNAEAIFGTRSSSAPGGTAGRAQDKTPPFGKTGARIAEGPRRDLSRPHERSRGYDDNPYSHKDTSRRGQSRSQRGSA